MDERRRTRDELMDEERMNGQKTDGRMDGRTAMNA